MLCRLRNVKRARTSAHVQLCSDGVVSASLPCEDGVGKVLASTQQCFSMMPKYGFMRTSYIVLPRFPIWKLSISQVQEQGELTIRIDENIDDTLANVDSAQAQLLKYMNSISSNRWLVMKVFAVLLFFLFVFIFFIAWVPWFWATLALLKCRLGVYVHIRIYPLSVIAENNSWGAERLTNTFILHIGAAADSCFLEEGLQGL